MTPASFSVTMHHLAPGAKAAGLGYADEQLPNVTAVQLVELLHALENAASELTIYEPSSPEIRIKTEREVHIVRTRYRRLCFVGRESVLRGEAHTVNYIMATVAGLAEPAITTATIRTTVRSSSAHPLHPRGGGMPDWIKAALLLVLSLACISGGVWMLLKPKNGLNPKFTYMPADDSITLINKVSGEYRTGVQEGARRLIVGSDGTLRIAKYGPGQSIAEEIIRTVRGATQDGQPGLATTDPYLMLIKDDNTVLLYGQLYKRVAQ